MLRIAGLALIAALGLSGCGTTAGIPLLSPSAQTSLNNIGTFTLADLANANKIALAQIPQTPQTQMDEQCFAALTLFVQNQQATVNTAGGLNVSGAFSAFEVARVGAADINSANLKAVIAPLEQGCGGTVVDTQNDIAGFLAN